MPPPNTQQARRRRQVRLMKSGVTMDAKKFTWLCRKTRNRIGIVAEGDSWFSDPPNLLFTGPNSNVIGWVVSAVKGSGKANLLRLASNGDEVFLPNDL